MEIRIFEPYEEEYGIKGKEHDSEDYFKGAINIAIEKYKISILEIADEFKVNEGTCVRWGEGKSSPLRSVRGVVVDRLADIVNEKQGCRR